MESGNPTIVAVYVDDLIVLTKALERMNRTKKSLAEQFKMKDLGEIHYRLGINTQRNEDKKCFIMHQKQYILAVVEKYGLSEANTVATPADVNVQLKKDDGISKVVDPTNYKSMVGSLLYASVATHPDITHAVGAVSKYCSKPNETHLTAVKRILRYLKGTAGFCLKFTKSGNGDLVGYADADWAGDLDDRHSTTGYVFLMAGGSVSWLSKKQPIVALSTAEAEYVALSMTTRKQFGSDVFFLILQQLKIKSQQLLWKIIKEQLLLLRIQWHMQGPSTLTSATIMCVKLCKRESWVCSIVLQKI